jgi:hypothetical protein
MNEAVRGAEEGAVIFAGLGQFRVIKVEKEVEGEKVIPTQIIFRGAKLGPGKTSNQSAQNGSLEGPLEKAAISTNYFFVHVPKTAGTSFRNALQRNERVNLLSDYGKDNPATSTVLVALEPEQLTPESSVFQADKYNFICGHVSYRKYAHCVSQESVVSIVRNPVERIVSEYQHLKRHAGLNVSFHGFISSLAQQNKQLKMLMSLDPGGGALIGLTSHYSYFVEVFSRKSGLPMESIAVNRAPVSDVEARFNISPEEIKAAFLYNKRDVNFFFKCARGFAGLVHEMGYNTQPIKGTQWNCRIDKGRRVVGWVSRSERDCYFIVIKVNDERRVVISLDEARKDVVEQGLTENPVCGFSYPLSLLGVENGDEISVGILGSPAFKRTLKLETVN